MNCSGPEYGCSLLSTVCEPGDGSSGSVRLRRKLSVPVGAHRMKRGGLSCENFRVPLSVWSCRVSVHPVRIPSCAAALWGSILTVALTEPLTKAVLSHVECLT